MNYYVNVMELMLNNLPRPRLRCNLHKDRAETLDQLGIVKVSGTDSDYYDGDNINRLHQMVQ